MGSGQPRHDAEGAPGSGYQHSSPQQFPGADGEEIDGFQSDPWSHLIPEWAIAVRGVDRRERQGALHEGDSDYRTILNILYIKGNPVYNAAFDEWNRQLKEVRDELDDKQKDRTDLVTQIYNIFGFFSVFQGVVFTAVSQLSSGSGEKCRKTWAPVLLSAIAAFVAFLALLQKFQALKDLEGLSKEPRAQRDQFQKRVGDLLKHGQRFRFYKPYPKDASKNSKLDQGCCGLHKGDHQCVFSPHLDGFQGFIERHDVVLVSVVLFTVLFILSYFVILCDKLLI